MTKLDNIRSDWRNRAEEMAGLPPESIGTGEMRVRVRQVLALLDYLDELEAQKKPPAG